MVLERGKDNWVSRYAADNPNCPPDIRIKWKKAIGKELTEEERKIESTLDMEILEVF